MVRDCKRCVLKFNNFEWLIIIHCWIIIVRKNFKTRGVCIGVDKKVHSYKRDILEIKCCFYLCQLLLLKILIAKPLIKWLIKGVVLEIYDNTTCIKILY
jgi:hypothetical protein